MKRRRRVREVNLAQVRARSLHLRESWVWVKVRFGVQHAFQCFETTQIFFRFEFRSMCVCVSREKKRTILKFMQHWKPPWLVSTTKRYLIRSLVGGLLFFRSRLAQVHVEKENKNKKKCQLYFSSNMVLFKNAWKHLNSSFTWTFINCKFDVSN